jgi:hypothetical protein
MGAFTLDNFVAGFVGALSAVWLNKLAELLLERYAKPRAVIVLAHGERIVLSMKRGLFEWKKERRSK